MNNSNNLSSLNEYNNSNGKSKKAVDSKQGSAIKENSGKQ